jgi:hypothetical protein
MEQKTKHVLTPSEIQLVTLLKEEIKEHNRFYRQLIRWIEKGWFESAANTS